MKKRVFTVSLVFGLIICLFSGCQLRETPRDQFIAEGDYQGDYWPTTGWRSCRPEDVDMDSNRLKQVYDYLAREEFKTQGVVITRRGYIIAEAYFGNFQQTSLHHSYSVAKSVTGALIGVAISKGLITSVQQNVSDFYSRWRTEDTPPWKRDMTIRHLLTMTSGLQWNETVYFGPDSASNDAYRMAAQPDFARYVLDRPAIHQPGTLWNYSSGDSMLLAGIVAAASGITARQFAQQNIFTPLGIPSAEWESDPSGQTNGGWGIHLNVRDFAKFGYLYLKKGRWENQQLVPEAWITTSVQRAAPGIIHYGYQWWRPEGLQGYPGSGIPANTYMAIGLYRQYIIVIPDAEIVISRVANDADSQTWSFIQLIRLALNATD